MKFTGILIALTVALSLSSLGCSRKTAKIGQPLSRAYSHIEQSVARNVDMTAGGRSERLRIIK
jgi:hypothetical protein